MEHNKDSKATIYHLIGKLVHGGLERQVTYYKQYGKDPRIKHLIFSTQLIPEIKKSFFDTKVDGGLLDILKKVTNEKGKIFLHCHTTKALLVGLLTKLFYGRILVSFHVHSYKILEYKWLKYFLRYCHSVICVNSNLAFEVNKLFFTKNISTIPNGIILKELKKGTIKNRNILGYVGRLEPEKNVLQLPLMYKEICKLNADINELVIFGNGSLYSELKRQLDLEAIKFTIHTNTADIEQIYSSIGALALTSKIESFSLSSIEALQFGLKVYTYDRISYNLFKNIYPEDIKLLDKNKGDLQNIPNLHSIKNLDDLDIFKITRMLELNLVGLE